MFPLGKLSLQINSINSNNNQQQQLQQQNLNNYILPSPSAFFFPQTFEAELVKFDHFDYSINNLKQEEEKEEENNYFLQEQNNYSSNHNKTNSLDYSNFSNSNLNSPSNSSFSSSSDKDNNTNSNTSSVSTPESSYASLELLDSTAQYSTKQVSYYFSPSTILSSTILYQRD